MVFSVLDASATTRLVFIGSNCRSVHSHPELAISYIIAPPRMAHYMEYSARIYEIYLKYVAPEDIHVYSIDEERILNQLQYRYAFFP